MLPVVSINSIYATKIQKYEVDSKVFCTTVEFIEFTNTQRILI